MRRFYIFKDGTMLGSTATRDQAVSFIREEQSNETHWLIRSEFSIIMGEQEFVPYPSQKKSLQKSRGMER